MFNKRIGKFTICFLLFIQVEVTNFTGYDEDQTSLQDQTSPRANKLFDDADDIQRQLDNEVRDRIKYGRPKTIWVFHFPQHMLSQNVVIQHNEDSKISRQSNTWLLNEDESDMKSAIQDASYIGWDYFSQDKWSEQYPDCAGRSQSPVNLPYSGILQAKGAPPIVFHHYDELPESMTILNDGQRVVLFGVWPPYKRPVIYGGAAYSRRYLFHSLALHWPSEHLISGLTYPLETQALFLSAEYKSLEEAVEGSRKDGLSMLGISNIYKYGKETHNGLKHLINSTRIGGFEAPVEPMPLVFYIPPFTKYVTYQGSLTVPPCTESVLWLVRANALYVEREFLEALESELITDQMPRKAYRRRPQPLNDRKCFMFK